MTARTERLAAEERTVARQMWEAEGKDAAKAGLTRRALAERRVAEAVAKGYQGEKVDPQDNASYGFAAQAAKLRASDTAHNAVHPAPTNDNEERDDA